MYWRSFKPLRHLYVYVYCNVMCKLQTTDRPDAQCSKIQKKMQFDEVTLLDYLNLQAKTNNLKKKF